MLITQDFGFQGAMKAFVFTLGLGMMRPGMRNANPEPQQPDPNGGVVAATAGAPGRTVVTGDPVGQAVAAKDLDHSCLGNVFGVSGAGLEGYGKARMVVQNGQRITTTLGKFEFAFEVHLPELIRRRPLEAQKGLMLGRLFRVE